MVESKVDYGIGHIRIKYLDLANIAFAAGNYQATKKYIDSFLDTIDEKSKAGINLKKELDLVTAIKNQNIKKLEEAKRGVGYLESQDLERDGLEEIRFETLHDKKEVCWRISLAEGLFNEQ